MIYGYANQTLSEEGLLEMREVTFATTPEVLREIGKFLLDMADLMEQGGFQRSSHRHIGSEIAGWDKRFPKKDIIVSSPV